MKQNSDRPLARAREAVLDGSCSSGILPQQVSQLGMPRDAATRSEHAKQSKLRRQSSITLLITKHFYELASRTAFAYCNLEMETKRVQNPELLMVKELLSGEHCRTLLPL